MSPTQNRENAQLSTGPKTEAGKDRSRFNARRHNLTGQTLIGTEEEMAAHADSSARLRADLKPEGHFELTLVQSIADAQFQLDRARAIESNLFFELTTNHLPTANPSHNPARYSPARYSPARQGGDPDQASHNPARQGGDTNCPHNPARQGGDTTSAPNRDGNGADANFPPEPRQFFTPQGGDTAIDWARAQARAFLENGKQFDLLSRYANRFHRQILQLHATLVRTQKERWAYELRRNQDRKRRNAEALQQHQEASVSRTHHSPKSRNGLVSYDGRQPSADRTGFVSQDSNQPSKAETVNTSAV